jgi:hypothetical protein
VQRWELPEGSAARRYPAMAAHPRLRLRAAGLDSAALRRAESAPMALAIVLRPRAVRTAAALGSAARLPAGSVVALAIASHPPAESVPEGARSSAAEFAVRARRLAGPVVLAAQVALPLAAAWDAVEAPLKAERDAAQVPPQEVVAWDVAEGAQEVAAWAEAEARQQAVAWVGAAALPPEAVRQQEARDVAALPLEAVLRAVPDARAAEPRAARPSAVPWVFRRDQALPWPAPQPAVRFERAMQSLRIALPSALSWQAVRDEVLS